jgi:acyl-CoA synthetase (AMP-forming)/AMP-acid ligase II
LQVSPSEIESILVVHPAIQDAAVVGIQDETYGELPGAFIVREPDTHITEYEIKDYVACKYPFSQTTESCFSSVYYYHDNIQETRCEDVDWIHLAQANGRLL